MSIYEYNEEYVRKALYEEGEENGYRKGEEAGYRKGKEEGYQKGENCTLVHTIESIMQNLHMDLQKACESAGVSVSEYEDAKKKIKGNK